MSFGCAPPLMGAQYSLQSTQKREVQPSKRCPGSGTVAESLGFSTCQANRELVRDPLETHQGEMTERLHVAPLNQAVSGAAGPVGEPCEREFHPPAEMPDQGGEAVLAGPQQPGFD